MTIQQDKNELPQSDLNSVHKLISLGQYKEALTTLDSLTQNYPNDSKLYLLGGNCYHAMGHFDQAILCYEEVIKLKPDYADAFNNLGICLYDLNKLDEALAMYQKAIKVNPDYADAFNNLGICFADLSRPEDAVKSYEKAIEIRPDFADAYNNLGTSLKNIARPEDAVKSYEKAIEIRPEYLSAYANLASILNELGRNEEATEFYAKARGGNKDFEQGLLMLEKKNFTEAIKYFEISHFANWQEKVLECHYRAKEFTQFKKKINEIKQKNCSPFLATLSAHYAQNFKTEDPYKFCPSPLDFVCHEQIPELIENDNQLIKELIHDINTAEILKRKYQYLFDGSSGEQSAGHLFKRPEKSFKRLSDALIKAIEKYFLRYKNEDNEFIRSFPKNINLCTAWYVRYFQGGHFTSHIHDYGWISGSAYLTIPKDSGPDGQEGAIELTSDGNGYPRLHDEFEKKVILPKVGDVVFFPSSVFHRTIPFNSKEERICIAFDVKPGFR